MMRVRVQVYTSSKLGRDRITQRVVGGAIAEEKSGSPADRLILTVWVAWRGVSADVKMLKNLACAVDDDDVSIWRVLILGRLPIPYAVMRIG